MKNRNIFAAMLLVFACVWLSLGAQAGTNTAYGDGVLDETTGCCNSGFGWAALYSDTSGFGNTAGGASALATNSDGDFNTAIGFVALFDNVSGNSNTAVGYNALHNVTTGSGNIALGASAGSAITENHDVICIGAPGPATASDACFIGHIFNRPTGTNTPVWIDANGRLGTQLSARRFKEEIKPMERSSEALYALKPVTFRYKKECGPQGILQFGLVAEDVEAVNPDLVLRDEEGKVNTVRYEQVNAMLLNEFLKEHRTVQELKKEIAALTSTVKEQAAQIQKVSAQIEMGKPAPKVVSNP